MAGEDPALLRPQVPLAGYTTWKVGGPAEWLAEPTDLEQLSSLMAWAQQRQMPWRVIGAGSNLLISDAGLPGLTLCLRKLQGMSVDATTGVVEALAGEANPDPGAPSRPSRAPRAGVGRGHSRHRRWGNRDECRCTGGMHGGLFDVGEGDRRQSRR